MNKKNCDPCDNCIEYHSTSCIKMGIEVQELDIDCGDTLDDVILKLGGVTKVEGECTNEFISGSPTVPVTAANMSAGAGNSLTSGVSDCAAQITDTQFQYEFVNTNINTELSYSLSFIKNLPAGFTVLDTQVSLVGPDGFIASGSATAQTFSIKPNQFPASFRISVRINSSCGQIEFFKTLSLSSNGATGTFVNTLSINDLSAAVGPTDLNQEQYNKVLESEIGLIKNRLASQENNTLSGEVAALQSSVSALESAESVATSEFITTTCSGGTETKSLTDIINAINASLCDIAGQITVLQNDQKVLQAQVDNLPSTITVS